MKQLKKLQFPIILIAIGVVIIGIGIIIFINQNNSSNVSTNNKTNEKEESSLKIQTNTNKNIKLEHCLDNLCIENMEMAYYNGLGSMNFDIKNKSTDKIPAGFIKIVDKNNQNNSFIAYYRDIDANATTHYQIQFTNDETLNIKDYKLEYLTEEEILEQQQKLHIDSE